MVAEKWWNGDTCLSLAPGAPLRLKGMRLSRVAALEKAKISR